MTKRTVTNHRFSFKSFLFRSKQKRVYLQSLEAAYSQQALEINRLKRLVTFLN